MTGMSAADRPERSVRSQPDPAGHSTVDVDEFERPGDAACWLRRVCPNCGTLADADPPTFCAQCREEISAQ
jgi:hypothetical protein